MEKITERQEKILLYIQKCLEEKGYPPSVRELVAYTGAKSTCMISRELGKLEEKGYIKKDPTKPRAITVLQNVNKDERKGYIPLVKQIISADILLELKNIDSYVPCPIEVKLSENYFAYKMMGNFLCEQGILDGDLLIFEICDNVTSGTIVAALADNTAMVGILSEGDILPANASMHPVSPDKIEIVGKLRGLSREF